MKSITMSVKKLATLVTVLALLVGVLFPASVSYAEDSEDIVVPPVVGHGTLHVVVHVINNNGGTRTAGDFPIEVTGPGNPTPSSFNGSESGTDVTINEGSFGSNVADQGTYSADFQGCAGSMSAGDTQTCTITLDDEGNAHAGTLHVIVHVINNNGGTKTASDFEIGVQGTNPNPFDFPGSEAGTDVVIGAGLYGGNISNQGGYNVTMDNCAGAITEGVTNTCTYTLDDIGDAPSEPVTPDLTTAGSGVNGSDSNTSSGTGSGDGLTDGGGLTTGGSNTNGSQTDDSTPVLETAGNNSNGSSSGNNDNTTGGGSNTSGGSSASFSGGSSGGSSGGGSFFFPPAGQVLGASASCSAYLHSYMRQGANNDPKDVVQLQGFLNEYMGSDITPNGVFGPATDKALRAFQLKLNTRILTPWFKIGALSDDITPTGYAYKTTLYTINDLVCPELQAPFPDLS